jgi:hypothetical protein
VVVAAMAGALAARLHTTWTAMCTGVSCAYLKLRLVVIRRRAGPE